MSKHEFKKGKIFEISDSDITIERLRSSNPGRYKAL